jgi:hypothetical protein
MSQLVCFALLLMCDEYYCITADQRSFFELPAVSIKLDVDDAVETGLPQGVSIIEP